MKRHGVMDDLLQALTPHPQSLEDITSVLVRRRVFVSGVTIRNALPKLKGSGLVANPSRGSWSLNVHGPAKLRSNSDNE